MSRLVDADDLIDGYRHMGYDPTEHEEESYMEGWCKGFNAAVDHCISHVIHATTIEPQRMKGRWIRYPKICKVECDQCGKRFRTDFTPRNFCPSCGADMRGDEK